MGRIDINFEKIYIYQLASLEFSHREESKIVDCWPSKMSFSEFGSFYDDHGCYSFESDLELQQELYARGVRYSLSGYLKTPVYDAAGFDQNGFDKFGYDTRGYDISGRDLNGLDEDGYGNDFDMLDYETEDSTALAVNLPPKVEPTTTGEKRKRNQSSNEKSKNKKSKVNTSLGDGLIEGLEKSYGQAIMERALAEPWVIREIGANVFDHFLSLVLSWDVSSIGKKIPIPTLPKCFTTGHDYYAYWQKFSLEESRASLFSGLQEKSRPEDCLRVELAARSEYDYIQLGQDLVVLEFRVSNTQLLDKERFREYVADFMAPGSVFQMESPASDMQGELLLASPRRGSRKLNKEGVIRLIVNSFSFSKVPIGGRIHAAPWILRNIGSVIVTQRIFAACQGYRSNDIPFISSVLGSHYNQPTKIQFNENGNKVDPHPPRELTLKFLMKKIPSFMLCFDKLPMAWYESLNRAQQKALCECLCLGDHHLNAEYVMNGPSTLKVIHGPPGCGKTHFLTSLLCMSLLKIVQVPLAITSRKEGSISYGNDAYWQNLGRASVELCIDRAAGSLCDEWVREMRNVLEMKRFTQSRNKCLLVCAPSNKAVSVLLENFLQNIIGTNLHNPQITLIGVKEKLNCEKNRDELKSLDRFYKVQKMTLRSGELMDDILFPKAPADVFVYTLADRLSDVLSRMIIDLDDGLFPEAQLNPFKKKLAAKDVEDLCRNIQATPSELTDPHNRRMRKLKANVNEVYHTFVKLTTYIDSLADFWDSKRLVYSDARDALEKVHKICVGFPVSSTGKRDIPKGNGMQTEFGDLKKTLLKLRDVTRTQSFSKNCIDWSLDASTIVFCTLSQTGSQFVSSSLRNKVETVFVDEAGQCNEAELLITHNLRPKNMVLVGDPLQLPAFVASESAAASGCSQSLMDRLMRNDYPRHLLDTQYRMHPDICSLPNQLFYGNTLRNSEHVKNRSNPVLQRLSHYAYGGQTFASFLGEPYCFIDIQGVESFGAFNRASYANVKEAKFISNICTFFSRVPGINLLQQLRIITFYAGQVEVIKRELSAKGLKHLVNNVNTVDSFQGSEADITILSFVRSNASNNVGFVKDMQRLNVSLTRSRYALICVGNTKTLCASENLLAEGGVSSDRKVLRSLHRLIQDARERNIIWEEK
eukprot:GSChrysophyteH1.ASY1.ANO1.214.1 assembled CDS